jgi:hypothetical protein
MKRGLLKILLLGAGTSTMVHAQGQINFDNRTAILGRPEPVMNCWTGTPLVGQDYTAQLFFADSMPPAVAQGPSTFRAPTTTLPGTWSGGLRDFLPSAGGPGATVNLYVAVWQGGVYSTIEQQLASGDAFSGMGFSHPFTYTIPEPTAPPDAFVMRNFTGFWVGSLSCIPEPSMVPLGVLGCLAFVLGYRIKQSKKVTI